MTLKESARYTLVLPGETEFVERCGFLFQDQLIKLGETDIKDF